MQVNFSATSVDISEGEEMYSDDSIRRPFNYIMLALQALGCIGNVMVFLVTRHMVKDEKKCGERNKFF